MACPTIAEFTKLLRRESAETVAREHVLGGDVFIAQQYPRVLNTLRRHLCPRFELDDDDVIIVGSAKMGFSLDPAAFPRRYSKFRDIDVLVVNQSLFDRFWHTMLRWHYPRRLAMLPNADWKWVTDRQRELYWGWFHPDQIGYDGLTFPEVLKPLRDLKANWFNSFKSLSLYEEFSGKDVNGRLYRTWQHALLYQADGLRQIQSRLVAEGA